MRKTEKNLQVSCMECIHRRRILTCHENQNSCKNCKNACTCRKCSPDASGKELPYEQRTYFSPGMSMVEYIQLKEKTKQSEQHELPREESTIDDNKISATSQGVDIKEKNNKLIKRKPTANKTKKMLSKDAKDISSGSPENFTTEKNGQLSFLWD